MTDEPTVSPASLDITVRTGTGSARTLLAAFDSALLSAGVANFNLITLSSVIPPGSRVRRVGDTLPGGHGDRLFCVLSAAYADHPGETAWAGLGWATDNTTGGLFVEHHGGSEASVREQIALSLEDMSANRGGGYGEVQTVVTSAHCVDRPVCALVIAAYTVAPWFA
ncbi:MAG: pyruvoyl-dependent arginine decarboxylase [Nocardioides sp.]|nr:pyruvoyl-dependent arginine decarboxylase [Nocardioides sp.]